METVSIIGLGLIGSSIGRALHRLGADRGKSGAGFRVTGYDVDPGHLAIAQEIKAIDRSGSSVADAVAVSDLIVVATPARVIPEVFRTIAEHGKPNVIVTDACSTKVAVMNWASEILPDWVQFVGGHPMAGKTESVEGADADLFNGTIWCLSPRPETADEALQAVLGLVEQVGAEPLLIDPSEHDSYVAGISHLPFLLSIALTRVADQHPSQRDLQRLSAGGFRDTTRLALGSPQMYRDICATNADQIVRWLDTTIGELQHLRGLIANGSDESLGQLQTAFTEARVARAEWMVSDGKRGTTMRQGERDTRMPTVGNQMRQILFGKRIGRRLKPGKEPVDRPGEQVETRPDDE